MEISVETKSDYATLMVLMLRVKHSKEFQNIKEVMAGRLKRTGEMPYADDIIQTFENSIRCLEKALNDSTTG